MTEARKTAAKKAAAPQARLDVGSPEWWENLRRPFPEDWIERLPKPVARDGEKGKCENRRISADGYMCGGWHSKAVHLSYVGHAGITMRLNDDAGPENWSFEPYAHNPDGTPVITGKVFWGRLTIAGVSKVEVAENFSSVQEAYGDCLRRAAMRFGLGTELWSKSSAAANRLINTQEVQESGKDEPTPPQADHLAALGPRLNALQGDVRAKVEADWNKAGFPPFRSISPEQAAVVSGWLDAIDEEARQALLAERLGAQQVEGGEQA